MSLETSTIDINNGSLRIDVKQGKSLFRALKEKGISLPSACGGVGQCGYCRLKTLSEVGPPTEAEKRHLEPEQLESGVRLSCQITVTGDVAVEIPPKYLKIGKFRGRVEQISNLTYDIRHIVIKLIEPQSIKFFPGQYVNLVVPPYRLSREPVERAYSMCNPPSADDRVELIVRLVPGGIGTTWIFEELTEGDEVKFIGPFGDFHLSRSTRDMIWIAGGSGMAPFWSMIRHMKEKGIDRKTTYFFGAVQRRDLFLTDELQQLQRELEWFTFIPALSAPEPADNWDGETGLITEVLDRMVPDASGMEVYLCGSPGMIDAGLDVLRRKNIAEEFIFFDKFI